MIRIPLETHQQYTSRLSELGVPSNQLPHFVKWVRYFLDYREKYGRELSGSAQLDGFLQKLADKGQSASLRQQAQRAVEVYQTLGEESNPRAVPQQPKSASVKVSRKSNAVAKSKFMAKPLPDSEVSAEWAQLIEQMKREIKRRDYSPKTLSNYSRWVEKFAAFCAYSAVDDISDKHAQAFLTDLAVEKKVVASTQNQAFNALLFLFRHILEQEYELGDRVVRAKQSKYVPVVLTREEVDAVLGELPHPFHLIVSVLYGCGLRVSEALNLRVSDLDFEQGLVIVRDGKGRKDRSVPLPKKLESSLKRQLAAVSRLHEADIRHPDYGGVFMPEALSKRRAKREAKELQWQWIFPAKELTLVPDEGLFRRFHNYKQKLGSEIKWAVKRAKIPKRVTAHTFRHSFASHLLAANVDLRTIQELLGHSDIKTTMIYTHTVKSRTKKEMVSPLDL